MQVKQQNMKSFDITIDGEVEFFAYFNKNLPLIQSHLIILRGNVTAAIIRYVKENKLAFVNANEVNISTKRAKKIESDRVEETVEDIPSQIEETVKDYSSLLIQRTIRSGENIEHPQDITIFGRINSGAKVVSDKNIKVFGIIEGEVEARGEYILLQGIGSSAHVLLQNEKIDTLQCSSSMTLVKRSSSGLIYKEI